MPTRLPGRRARGGAGNLKPWEKALIAEWLIKGHSVMEVYAQCLDNGIEPPQEQAIYRILNTDEVQSGLRERKALEAKNRIARIADRTRERQDILTRIKNLADARADHYAGFVPGGETGLMVLTDKKTIRTSEVDYDTVDIYKADTALLEQWRGVLADQEKSDEALRRNLRLERDRASRDEEHEQQSEIRALEIIKRTAEVEAIEDEAKRKAEGGYEAPTFSEFFVERLPTPERPASAEDEKPDEEEGATPAIPWILEDSEADTTKTASQEAATGALE